MLSCVLHRPLQSLVVGLYQDIGLQQTNLHHVSWCISWCKWNIPSKLGIFHFSGVNSLLGNWSLPVDLQVDILIKCIHRTSRFVMQPFTLHCMYGLPWSRINNCTVYGHTSGIVLQYTCQKLEDLWSDMAGDVHLRPGTTRQVSRFHWVFKMHLNCFQIKLDILIMCIHRTSRFVLMSLSVLCVCVWVICYVTL